MENAATSFLVRLYAGDPVGHPSGMLGVDTFESHPVMIRIRFLSMLTV
jgi:hypothetical protein